MTIKNRFVALNEQDAAQQLEALYGKKPIRTGATKTHITWLQFYAWPVPSAEPFEEQHELRLSVEYWEPGKNPNIDAKTAFEVVMMPGVEDAKPEVVSTNPAAPVQPRESEISWDQDYFKLTVPFNNRQPMPTWCWEEGDVLNDNDATRNSLTREYRRLHALFAAGDNDALLAAASTRTTELALASGCLHSVTSFTHLIEYSFN